jgi:glucokinase
MQPGRQRVTGKLLATQGYVLGIEISGSGGYQSVALANLDGTILHTIRCPSQDVADTSSVLKLVNEMIGEVTDAERLCDGRLLRVGVAVGGLVDVAQGVVRTLYRAYGWDNFPLQDYFAERLGIPCIIDNNANAAALAEVQRGVGIGERSLLYVGLDRGIGGGLIVNGRVYHGASCAAGEIGHMLVEEQGPQCSCGRYGHLESIASAQAIMHAMIGMSAKYAESEVVPITVEQIYRLAAEGDNIAQQVVNKVHQYLAIALANIVHLVNPGMIVLGGSVAQVGELLIRPTQIRLRELCLAEAFDALRVVQSSLGEEASIIGAVTLALQDM